MIVDYTWDDIRILPLQSYGKLKEGERFDETKRWVFMGRADKDFEQYKLPIFIGACYLRSQDEIDDLTLEEIIVHETVHQLIFLIAGSAASWSLDKMVFRRDYIDGNRIHIQKNKVVL